MNLRKVVFLLLSLHLISVCVRACQVHHDHHYYPTDDSDEFMEEDNHEHYMLVDCSQHDAEVVCLYGDKPYQVITPEMIKFFLENSR